MRDENGVKPPYESLEWWRRFLLVYGMGRDDLIIVRPLTKSRAEAMEAVAAFQRRYPHLMLTGRDSRNIKPPPP
jgi:hypothetical protein